MRDPDRIDRYLEWLRWYWKRHPDLRLGQIVVNANRQAGMGDDAFFIEDQELFANLVQLNPDGESWSDHAHEFQDTITPEERGEGPDDDEMPPPGPTPA